MKIEQQKPKPKFEPLTITAETPEEANYLLVLLQFGKDLLHRKTKMGYSEGSLWDHAMQFSEKHGQEIFDQLQKVFCIEDSYTALTRR